MFAAVPTLNRVAFTSDKLRKCLSREIDKNKFYVMKPRYDVVCGTSSIWSSFMKHVKQRFLFSS